MSREAQLAALEERYRVSHQEREQLSEKLTESEKYQGTMMSILAEMVCFIIIIIILIIIRKQTIVKKLKRQSKLQNNPMYISFISIHFHSFFSWVGRCSEGWIARDKLLLPSERTQCRIMIIIITIIMLIYRQNYSHINEWRSL